MVENTASSPESETRVTWVKEERKRKPYIKPRLDELGDLRSVTLGVSFGTGESGSSQTHKDQGF